ncbi:hypothetical protein LN426_19145 [Pseudomonas syringae]|uniref:hypothetical protein n=1 Tax=Pseudomonas syringae TaxID=317 RepID=UPI00234D1151|nr:hypothetical protein [Pseudomonas syringae]MDC6494354.1 hypothetical protein [Pseudomonas syringae]MDC6527183.1 hypothetical protein [Pseudomonas syringae]MDC6534933.1 hypothetical protein [Pseudomonas syringae]
MTNQTKERPILFSAPMVRAILEGRKTVTRREVKKPAALDCLAAGFKPAFLALPGNADLCPYGRVGDRLWVRETWYCDHFQVLRGPYLKPDDLDVVEAREDGSLVYAADGLAPYETEQPVWKPSIHMPRWASRTLLEITDVRVERLQAGDGETAFESRYVVEGINRIHQGDGEYAFHPFKNEPGPGNWIDPFDAWRELWVSINGADSWNANPWVWVVEFKRGTP